MLGHDPIEVLFARRFRPPGNTRTPVIRPPIGLHLRIGHQSKAGWIVFCGAATLSFNNR
jgi:hypothetical protein